jgi:hypothetical protein
LGPAAGIVAQEHGFDELADGCLFVGVEALGAFESEKECLSKRLCRHRSVDDTRQRCERASSKMSFRAGDHPGHHPE